MSIRRVECVLCGRRGSLLCQECRLSLQRDDKPCKVRLRPIKAIKRV
jgi:hypothetical protein